MKEVICPFHGPTKMLYILYHGPDGCGFSHTCGCDVHFKKGKDVAVWSNGEGQYKEVVNEPATL